MLRTVFTTEQGTVAVTDALALEPGAAGTRSAGARPAALVRTVEGLSGSGSDGDVLRPRFEYGRVTAYLVQDGAVTAPRPAPTTLTMTASVPVSRDDIDASARFTVGPGQRETFALAYSPTYGDGDRRRGRPGVPWRWPTRSRAGGPGWTTTTTRAATRTWYGAARWCCRG